MTMEVYSDQLNADSTGAPHQVKHTGMAKGFNSDQSIVDANGAPHEGEHPGMAKEFDYDQLNADANGAPHQGETRFWEDMDPSNPIGYVRDPHRLIAYLIPFPKPTLAKGDPSTMPERFLIYTPPPPPLVKPAEGVKEGKIHKVQRKWKAGIHDAKTSTAKPASWKGIKSKTLTGISWAAQKTTTSNLDFLSRFADNDKHEQKHESEQHEEEHEQEQPADEHPEDGVIEEDMIKKTVGVEEIVLVYPPTTGLNPEQIKEEFVNSILRTRTKAQREAIISTALLPVAFIIDLLAFPLCWLGEIDTVWAYTSIRGAKTARSVTKRLSSWDSPDGTIRMNFVLSDQLEVMQAYLVGQCQRRDPKLFPGSYEGAPTDEDVLKAIAWSPSEKERNWEDEQWEVTEVKLDLKNVMKKGAKEWIRWCKAFQKNPKKAAKK